MPETGQTCPCCARSCLATSEAVRGGSSTNVRTRRPVPRSAMIRGEPRGTQCRGMLSQRLQRSAKL
eukprot:scaffold30736_cov17-Tisochrysis_lutea.AAC.4